LEPLEPRALLSLQSNVLFPADNPWNTKVNGAPVAANSGTLVSAIGASARLHPDFGNALYLGAAIGIPYVVVPGDQPKVNVVIDAYPNESDILPVPIPAGAPVEGDPLSPDLNTGDRHLLIYDKDHNVVYELFHARRPAETPDGQWHADSEAVWDLGKNSFRTPGDTSADAAGLPILPGLIRPDEVLDQGVINHALRFTVPNSRNTYVFPATHQAGVNNSSLPRMGERFRLKQSFNIAGYSAANRVILQALKDYGIIVADNGGSWFLSGQPSSRWDDDDLHRLTAVLGSNFEAVDMRPVVTALNQSAGTPAGGATISITGQNFTGLAGNTPQVFFGTTAATNVTVVSDTLLTAAVPAHAAGIVDVTVRSPYGTSSTAVADRYTYAGVPAAPQLPAPANAASVQRTPATLDWADATGATSYDVYLDGVLKANVSASQWTVGAPPALKTLHSWQVIAKGPGGTTAGPTWNFRIDPIPGDANADGVVNEADFVILYAHLNQPADWSTGDFTGDGVAGFKDFQILELNFGNVATTPSEPAPAGSKSAPPTPVFATRSVRRPVTGIVRRRTN
jgi:hypothetical protein